VVDISAKTIAAEASPERVSSGVEPPDARLGGGYYRGSKIQTLFSRYSTPPNA